MERHLRVLERAASAPTLGEAACRLSEVGLGLALIFVCLPFLQPLPMGGLSTVIGPFVFLQGVQLARGRTALWIPAWIARRPLGERGSELMLSAARRLLALAARFTRPRWRSLARAERASGVGIALSGALLSLPIPIPLSNISCAAPVCLWSLALLEDDGLLAALGWLGLALNVAFHFGVLALGISGLRAMRAPL